MKVVVVKGGITLKEMVQESLGIRWVSLRTIFRTPLEEDDHITTAAISIFTVSIDMAKKCRSVLWHRVPGSAALSEGLAQGD